MIDILKKEINMSIEEAVPHIEKILEEEGFTVMLTKHIDKIFKMKLGIEDYPKYVSIMACGAKLAKMALDVSFDVGLVFPCSFVVYKEDGKTIVSHVSIMKIAKEIGLASAEAMAPVIEVTGQMVHKVWDRI